MEKWSAFAVLAGGAAAALTGLLFVAVSIRIDVIARSQELRNRGDAGVNPSLAKHLVAANLVAEPGQCGLSALALVSALCGTLVVRGGIPVAE